MAITQIFFRQLKLHTSVGILDHEINTQQGIAIDVDITLNIPETQINDEDIDSVLDYREIRSTIKDECQQSHTNLVEVLGDRIARRLLRDFALIQSVKLRIDKPMAFEDCDTVGIECIQHRNSNE